MLSFFRRMIRHRFGAAIALGLVALLGLGFVLSDRSSLSGSGSTVAKGDVAATVGSKTISLADLTAAVRRDYEGYRQQRPTLTMAEFVTGGGFDATLERLIDSTGYRQYAESQGMIVSKKAVDGVIARDPVTFGLDGKFDQQRYDAAIAQAGLTDAAVRVQTADQILVRQMLLPLSKVNLVPTQVALPYSSMLLQRRSGLVGFIPTEAIPAGPPPGDAELTDYYTRNVARYRVPERRVVRYATLTAAAAAAQAVPSQAEIAAAFTAQSAKYAAADVRTIVQVIVADQAAATALAAKVRSGTPIEQAARAAGLEPATIADVQKPAYAVQASPALADAAFAAKAGDVVGPIRGPFGLVVAKIAKQTSRPAKTLAEATPELKEALAKQKGASVLTERRNGIDDALANTGFDGLVAKNGMVAVRTPALLANGLDIDAPTAKPDPALAPILAAAFAAQSGDGPQTVPLGADGSFALVMLDRIVPPAPRALALIRADVTRDFTIERSERAAHAAAASVVLATGKGMTLAQAMAATGLRLPPVKPVTGPRAILMGDPQRVPPPLQLLFAMAAGTTKLLAAPDKAGYFLIHLDTIVPGDARGKPDVIAGTRSGIGSAVGREYIAQFAKAVQRAIGVTRNTAAIVKLKSDLIGGVSATDQP